MTEIVPFPPTRASALSRLAAFVPQAGLDYSQGRNSDPGPGHRDNVSLIWPYLRHRVITECEVVAAVLPRLGIALVHKRRSWDAQFLPYTRKRFFAFEEKIPSILAQEGMC
jgi:deoxyribodipyrimidine photolyase